MCKKTESTVWSGFSSSMYARHEGTAVCGSAWTVV